MSEQEATSQVAETDPRVLVENEGLRGYATAFARRVRSGDLGPVPVVVGLVVIWTIFQTINSNFLSPANLTNLALQSAATGTIAVGIVLVLLLGQIDLSVGSVSGATAALLAVLNVLHGLNAVVAILAALAGGALIGLFQGLVVTRFGVPSFVVTLAGLIGWQGLLLWVLGKEGTINLPFEGGVASLANTFFPPWVGFVLVAAVVVVYLATSLRYRTRRAGAGLPVEPMLSLVVRTTLVLVLVLVAVLVLNRDRGVPLALVIFLGFAVVFDVILRRTRYGRQIFAVGGNKEAARRAGINVNLVTTSVFVICSTMAAAGGILAASRQFSVGQQSGSADILLNAIAAAVIGGTSLFGGRGSTWAAVLGILVIQSIANGMFLVQVDASVRFMITGAVLLAAVVIDAVSRRGRQIHGRA